MQIPDLTPELLVALSRELGGCDFSDTNQVSFLSSVTSCDVQAAPGNGKTTLLAAKIALLSRTWTTRKQGVCIISHTNAAREEIERLLSDHATAGAFLNYPHYVGTVTTFVDHFLALPYLRGLGWHVKRIDDELFAAIAKAKYPSRSALRSYAHQARKQLEDWVSTLQLAGDFECVAGRAPEALKVAHRPRQPKPPSATGIALQELKAELVNAGLYRYSDMTVLANKALDAYPALADRLRTRFPLVILDEAQDTNGDQLALLNRLFGEGTAFQRLGDQNQTLYEDPDLPPSGYWQPQSGAIPLNDTRRFGQGIAAFASRLTARTPQTIVGKPNSPDRRVLFLFDQPKIGDVLPAYVRELHDYFGVEKAKQLSTWAVASRHNSYADTTGGWPKSLVDYYPPYRSGRGARTKPNSFCAAMREASVLYRAHKSTSAVMDLMIAGLIEALVHMSYQCPLGRRLSSRSIWRSFAELDSKAPLKIRRMLRDKILCGQAPWEAGAWSSFCDELRNVLSLGQPASAAASYLQFNPEGAAETQGDEQSNQQASFGGQLVRLGSIHSVKGKSVDSILVVETEVYRGQALSQRAMDLATVLPHAFGIEDQVFSSDPAKLAAATNVFVGITRPRHFLGLAMRKSAASAALLSAAASQQWHVVDLTASPEQPDPI